MRFSDTPVYNLRAALRETGIKADVLRAWERRYGLPRPHRTPGGHRLYSQRDIQAIRWLITRQGEGLSISRAVDLWREIEGESRDPLEDSHPAPGSLSSPDSSLASLRAKWLAACMSFDETAAEEVLTQALSYYPVERVVVDVVQHGLRQLGESWFRGDTTVQQEHFASALATRRIEALIAATPPPTRPQVVLTACPPGEWHTFSLLILNLLIRRRGYNVVYLGADVPNDHLHETTRSIRPGLVVLACQHLTGAAQLRGTASMLADKGVQVAYGGRVFSTIPSVRKRIPGHFLGESLEASLEAIERLVSFPQPLPQAEATPERARHALAGFRERRGLIESALMDELKLRGLSTDYVETADHFFGDGIAAALELGDIALLEPDMSWLRALLAGQRVSPDLLRPYLVSYAHAIRKVAGGDLALITDWIDTYVRNETGD